MSFEPREKSFFVYSKTLKLVYLIYIYRKKENHDYDCLLGTNVRQPDIGLVVRVFANGPGDLDSIPGQVIPKTPKMVLDASLLNTQHYKVRIKGKMGQSWERSSGLPSTLL